jgi:hypothetical protein
VAGDGTGLVANGVAKAGTEDEGAAEADEGGGAATGEDGDGRPTGAAGPHPASSRTNPAAPTTRETAGTVTACQFPERRTRRIGS